MKKLHTFVLRSYLVPLVVFFIIAVFILLMQFIWKYVDDMVGKGLDISVIIELLAYATAYVVPMALPLAILVASLITFGNLGEYYELTALKSSGISLKRIMSPLILVTFLVSIGAFFFANNVMPYTNLKMGTLLYDVRQQRPELNLRAGGFNNDIDNYTIKVGRKNYKTNMMYNFIIYDHSHLMGNIKVTIADSAKMRITPDKKYMRLTLYHGSGYEEMKDQHGMFPHNRYYFSEQELILNTEGFQFVRTNENLFKQQYQMLNLKKLTKAIDTLEREMSKRKNYISENMMNTNFLRTEIKPIYNMDSIKKISDKVPTTYSVNLDSLMAKYSKTKQKDVYTVAANLSRSTAEYVSSVDRELKYSKENINKHKSEWHSKFTLAFACLFFFFVGAPLGAIIRRGGLAVPIVIGALFFIFYYVISLTGKKLVVEGLLPAPIGMWLASFIIFMIGLLLTVKASNESSMMSLDAYLDFFRRLFKRKEL